MKYYLAIIAMICSSPALGMRASKAMDIPHHKKLSPSNSPADGQQLNQEPIVDGNLGANLHIDALNIVMHIKDHTEYPIGDPLITKQINGNIERFNTLIKDGPKEEQLSNTLLKMTYELAKLMNENPRHKPY